MLSRILQEFRQQNKPIELKSLSRELEIEPDALQGMLEHLEQLGKLERVNIDAQCSQACTQCASAAECHLLTSVAGIRWRLRK